MTIPSSQVGNRPTQNTADRSQQPRTPADTLRAAAGFLESAGQHSGVIATCSAGGIRIRVTEPYADAAARRAILTGLAGLIGGTIWQEDHDFVAVDLRAHGTINGLPAVVLTGLEVRRARSRTGKGRPLAEPPDSQITTVTGKLPEGWRWVTELDPQTDSSRPGAASTATAPAGNGEVLACLNRNTPEMHEIMAGKVVTAVNSYGAKALDHWRRHLPGQLAQIQDPQAFFTHLGDTAATEIDQTADALAQTQPPGEGYLEEAARLATARATAEMQVTRELILVDPEDKEKIAQLMG